MPNWGVLEPGKTVSAPKTELWVRASDFVRGPRRLLIEATGTWKYDANWSCGPDGNPAEGFDDANLHKSALRGCLLAKIGGSAGDTPGSEKILAIGSYCVLELAESASGCLFITMNDNPKRFYLHDGTLTIKIS